MRLGLYFILSTFVLVQNEDLMSIIQIRKLWFLKVFENFLRNYPKLISIFFLTRYFVNCRSLSSKISMPEFSENLTRINLSLFDLQNEQFLKMYKYCT